MLKRPPMPLAEPADSCLIGPGRGPPCSPRAPPSTQPDSRFLPCGPEVSATGGPRIYVGITDRGVFPLLPPFLIFDLPAFKRHISSLFQPINQPRPRSDLRTNPCCSALSVWCLRFSEIRCIFKGGRKEKYRILEALGLPGPYLTQPWLP